MQNKCVKGIVVHGDGRGKKIGMPTANLEYQSGIENGVYATKVTIDDKIYKAVTNVGTRPSVDNKNYIEAHIIDFDEEIYGKEISIEFIKKLRETKKFESLTEVKKQVEKDIDVTKTI